jgi:hypothetical protein
MGVLETLLLLGGAGALMYFGTFYILPYIQQMSVAPYYYLQAALQQQGQQPIMQQAIPPPAPAPAPAVAVAEPAPTTDTNTDLANKVENKIEDVLEENGLKKEPTAEEKETTRRSTAEETLKKSNAEQTKRRAEYDTATDPTKDTRYTGLTSQEAGRKAAETLGLYNIIDINWGIVTPKRYRSINDL